MAKIELAASEQPCDLKDPVPVVTGVPLVVDFQQVTKTFDPGGAREFTAIRDVTFAVADLPKIGEFVGILGPSGCGKSTVLRLIAGLAPQFPATSGTVRVHGEPVSAPGPDRGFVFQDYANFPHRTVLDNVAFGLECQQVPVKERHDRARTWLAKVGLDPRKDAAKYPHQLSGGMNQRVAIARTLILHPRIILMDEPFGALDPSTRQNMQDLLVSLWKELEATVFFITHDVGEAVFLADRIYLFSASPGTIVKQVAITPPDRKSVEMQAVPAFQESVRNIRQMLDAASQATPSKPPA